jgi:hypothetical protein
MIAAAGTFRLAKGDIASWDSDVDPNLRMG